MNRHTGKISRWIRRGEAEKAVEGLRECVVKGWLEDGICQVLDGFVDGLEEQLDLSDEFLSAGLPDVLATVMDGYTSSLVVMRTVISTFAHLACRDAETVAKTGTQGGVDAALVALREHGRSSEALCVDAFALLAKLCACVTHADTISQDDTALETLFDLAREHLEKSPRVTTAVLGCLSVVNTYSSIDTFSKDAVHLAVSRTTSCTCEQKPRKHTNLRGPQSSL